MSAQVHETTDLLVSYTLFPTVWPKTKVVRSDKPWADLLEIIYGRAGEITFPDKASCPLISMADYGDTFDADHKCLRYAENVIRVYGAELDYDGERMSIDEAAAALSLARLRAVLYTSPSHTPEKPRWRALLPFSEPALPDKRAEYVGRANRALGGIASRESFALSQSFYIGRVQGAEYEVRDTDGRCVDVAYDIEPLYWAGSTDNGKVPRDATTDAQLRQAFELGAGRYTAMQKLSGRWAARGMSADDIEANLIALLGHSTRNADGVDLAPRARDLAISGVRKYGETRRPPIGLAPAPRPANVSEDGEIVDPPAVIETPALPGEPQYPRLPIPWLNLSGKEVPERKWKINHWLSTGATLLAGSGGVGKTMIAQTIATALAIGRPYINDVPEPQRVLFWACEDEHDELWRRQVAICDYFGVTFSDIAENLIVMPRIGLENTLFHAAQYGALQWTGLYGELISQVNDYKADVTILDNVGQTFGGNENDRHHVTAYMNGLIGLTKMPHSLILLAHPAKAAESEFSGSTAWENSVRMRWYVGNKLPDADKDAPVEPDVRYLTKRKTNYSSKDEYVKLTYSGGVFAMPLERDQSMTERYGQQYRDRACEEVVLKALDRFLEIGERAASGTTSPAYVPKRICDLKMQQDFSKREVSEAFGRLLLAGRMVDISIGKNSNRTAKLTLVRKKN